MHPNNPNRGEPRCAPLRSISSLRGALRGERSIAHVVSLIWQRAAQNLPLTRGSEGGGRLTLTLRYMKNIAIKHCFCLIAGT